MKLMMAESHLLASVSVLWCILVHCFYGLLGHLNRASLMLLVTPVPFPSWEVTMSAINVCYTDCTDRGGLMS